ncbi:MAG TPA: glycosyl hydrolase [Acidimicrobiia bacterium]|nr:glycosyl hydrolase [Acidimicrobiia bacterium]
MPTQLRRTPPRRPWIIAALAALFAAATLAPGATAGEPLLKLPVDLPPHLAKGGKVVPPKSGTWVGTYEESSGSQIVKQNRLFDMEELIGRKVDVDHNYTAWNEPFPGWREKWDIAHGRVPFVSWAKTSTSAINSGRYDGMIRKRAAEVKQFGHPILLEWFWEMDGRRNRHIAKSPASFIAAWKRIHRIFDRAGVENVSWVWCPNAWGFHTGEAQKYYPGDEYVDWICANGYNWAPGRDGDQWRSFEWIFQDFYDWAVNRGKPLMIGEFGAQERKHGEKAEWIREAAQTLKTKFPEIKAVVYFNVKKRYDWRIDTSSARSAWKYLAREVRPDQ